MAPIKILYFTDVLCVWAYIGQLRVDAIVRAYPDQVRLDHRFCSVFGDTARKIPAAWGEVEGYNAFSAHLRHSLEAFPEVTLNPKVWTVVRPASSMAPHLFLKAIQLAERDGECAPGAFEAAARAMRSAFFEQAQDIAVERVQQEVAMRVGVRLGAVQPSLRDGRAHAALASDYQDAQTMGVQGSPTFLLNDGRQKLYGNVGYRIIEANIQELLRDPNPDQASWC